MSAIIECRNLTHYYGRRLIYRDLSFDVPQGRILGLLGRAVVVCILPNLLNLAFYIWTSDAAYLRTQAGRLWQKITHR